MRTTSPILFISYSWDSKEHQDWVRQLANDLMAVYGVQVLLDQYELTAGRELTLFMETSIERADKVLLILSPNYKLRAEGRQGGVGYETSMISSGLYQVQVGNDKFIPVLRQGDLATACPTYVQGRIYHDMRNSSHYDQQLHELARLIYEEPQHKKPELGPIPDFSDVQLDPLLRQMKALDTERLKNAKLDDLLESEEGIKLLTQEVQHLYQLIEQKVKLYNAQTTFRFATNRIRETQLELTGAYMSFYYSFTQRYCNSTNGSMLLVTHTDDYRAGRAFGNRLPSGTDQQEWAFNVRPDKTAVWVSNARIRTSKELVEEAFTKMFDKQRADIQKHLRN